MDVQHISPFVDSICNTFETKCSVKVDVATPELRSCNAPTSDVAVVVGFSGDAAGCVALHFDAEVAAKIASAFAQITITPDQAGFADAVGELASRIARGAMAKFEGLSIDLALPKVFVGESHCDARSRLRRFLLVPCTTKLGTFLVEIGMKVQKPAVIKNEPATVGANS